MGSAWSYTYNEMKLCLLAELKGEAYLEDSVRVEQHIALHNLAYFAKKIQVGC